MNESVASSIPRLGLDPGKESVVECLKSLGEQFAFLHLPSGESAQPSVDEVVRKIGDVLDDLVRRVVEKKTASAFQAARKEVLPSYFRALRSISDIAMVVIGESARDRLVESSFSWLDEQLRRRGDSFGVAVKEQALFTVWTFRKIDSLIRRIVRQDAPKEYQSLDATFTSNFTTYVVWARFHLDCLLVSTRHNIMISKEIREDIADGLRGAVNAYAYAMQAVKLRHPAEAETINPPEWDAEDQALLEASMRDLETEEE